MEIHLHTSAGRYLYLRVCIPDLPGGLAGLLTDIGAAGAHVLEVAHERISPNHDHCAYLGTFAQGVLLMQKPGIHVVDATGLTLGRMATQIADTLRGKRKPTYTPHVDTGDFVVVINAEKIAVTGNKRADKLYYRHSGYPGGLKTRTLNDMLERRPEEVLRLAVKGMLPRNRLARKQLTKLKIYAGPEHPHQAQKPQPMELKS